MNNFSGDLYKYLIENEKFYMKQYYSRFYSKETYVAVRNVENGLYCVVITNSEDENINTVEVLEYLRSLNKPFSLNIVVLADEDYINTNDYNVNKIIVNKKNNNIIQFDEGCRPLAGIIHGISARKNMSTKEVRKSYLKYKTSTLVIIALNIIMFLITTYMVYSNLDKISASWGVSYSSIPESVKNIVNNNVLILLGAKYGPLIYSGEIWRLITCAFLHGGILHIACNMYMLYIIGPQIEQIYGKVRYIIIYLISCITSSALSLAINPDTISVGASGGIFGLMGSLLVFALIERKNINKEYTIGLIKTIGINLVIGLVVINIDNAAHIGGFLGGAILGGLLYKLKFKKQYI
ncbi:MAG: rhomboid family intramembrane serine protease [Clostridium sp.]